MSPESGTGGGGEKVVAGSGEVRGEEGWEKEEKGIGRGEWWRGDEGVGMTAADGGEVAGGGWHGKQGRNGWGKIELGGRRRKGLVAIS